MNTMSSNTPLRDFNSVSPSARALLLLKGLTDIPFAREAATLISAPSAYEPDLSAHDYTLWARTIHFEVRYKSINSLLAGLPVTNILELSSGFSFRGLYMAQRLPVYYIDTDLPDLIDTKKTMNEDLQGAEALTGRLEVLPLNALDEENFDRTVAHFPPGPLAVVNEGLLMYLNMEEKEQLCAIIRRHLQQRGGYWITADVYIRTQTAYHDAPAGDKLQEFFQQHHIQDNMFESFDAAEAFFKEQGFIIDQEAPLEYAASALLPQLMQSATPQQLEAMAQGGRIHATWRLRLG